MFVLLNSCPKCFGNLYPRVDDEGAYLSCVDLYCLWVGDAVEFGEDWRAMELSEDWHEE